MKDFQNRRCSRIRMSRTLYPSVLQIRTRSHGKNILTTSNGLDEIEEDVTSNDVNADTSVCATPVQRGLLRLREKMESQNLREDNDNTSPTLTMLRITPGHRLKEKQQILVDKHKSLKENIDNLSVGGGVSIWPAMDRMRISQREIIQLGLSAAALLIGVIVLFFKMHGSTLMLLSQFTHRLSTFWTDHPVDISRGYDMFTKSLMTWHSSHRTLLAEINQAFDMTCSSCLYHCFLVSYLLGLIILLYYLADNMFSKSRLSPRRIKAWVCLLTVIGTWTLLMVYFLVLAHTLEYAVEANVHRLFEILADLVDSDYDLHRFDLVLMYWRTHCLPPTTSGVLTILGILPVRSVAYYLQYYSLPVLTVLITPVVKLISAVYQVYGNS